MLPPTLSGDELMRRLGAVIGAVATAPLGWYLWSRAAILVWLGIGGVYRIIRKTMAQQ